MSNQVFHLMERHQQIDRRIQEALLRRWTDPLEIIKLKKLKLAVKDRIAAALLRRTARV
jgi:uncharacterized protein